MKFSRNCQNAIGKLGGYCMHERERMKSIDREAETISFMSVGQKS